MFKGEPGTITGGLLWIIVGVLMLLDNFGIVFLGEKKIQVLILPAHLFYLRSSLIILA